LRVRPLKKLKTIFIAGLCVSVLVLSAFTYSCHAKREKLKNGFAGVQIGDTKQTVVQVLGQPEEVENCYSDPRADPDKICIEVYWYKSFLERRGISFNRDSRVVYKTYNVLY
jgi:hypothetical protein